MPRERVHDHRPPGVIIGGPDDGQPDTSPTFVIDIGWTNGLGGVTVHTTPERDSTRILLGMVNGWLETAEMPTIDIDKLLAADPGFGWADSGGFHTHLYARESVNRLITVLRKARDGAFGKDA